jgi:hypothetical protein
MAQRALGLLKVVVAAAAVVALVAVPARRLAPNLTLAGLIFYLVLAFFGLVVLAVCSLQVAQFVLRKGGTDTQWFWFSAEPPGLQEQREKMKEAARES